MDIAVTVDRVGRASFTLAFDVTVEGRKAARGKVTIVCIDRQTQRAIPLPERLRAALVLLSVLSYSLLLAACCRETGPRTAAGADGRRRAGAAHLSFGDARAGARLLSATKGSRYHSGFSRRREIAGSAARRQRGCGLRILRPHRFRWRRRARNCARSCPCCAIRGWWRSRQRPRIARIEDLKGKIGGRVSGRFVHAHVPELSSGHSRA